MGFPWLLRCLFALLFAAVLALPFGVPATWLVMAAADALTSIYATPAVNVITSVAPGFGDFYPIGYGIAAVALFVSFSASKD